MILPLYIDFLDWAASLVIDFPTENIPVLYNENDWKDYGNQLVLCDSFYDAGAPGTDSYDDRQKWAMDVYFAMMNST